MPRWWSFWRRPLHDIGHAIHRTNHEEMSLILAPPIIKRMLEGLYDEAERTIMMVETMHAMISHHEEIFPLTLEAGVVRVADALDMEKGRAPRPIPRREHQHSFRVCLGH